MNLRRISLGIVVALATFAIAIAALEFALRFTNEGQLVIDRLVPEIGRTRAPNQTGTLPGNGAFGEFVRVRINADGLRGAEIPATKGANEVRVLCLGDSFVFGGGLNDNDTFPAIAERLLGGQAERVRFMNAGGNGFDTRESAAFLAYRGASLEPDIVVVGWNWNDLVSLLDVTEYPLAPEWIRKIAIYKYWRFQSNVKPWSQPTPERFDKYRKTVLACATGEDTAPRWKAAETALLRLVARSRSMQAKIVVLIMPELTWKESAEFPAVKRLTSILDPIGVPWVDAQSAYYDGIRSGEVLTQALDPFHPNGKGQALLAKVLCEALVQQKWLPSEWLVGK